MSSISNVLKRRCFRSKRNKVMIMNVIDALSLTKTPKG